MGGVPVRLSTHARSAASWSLGAAKVVPLGNSSAWSAAGSQGTTRVTAGADRAAARKAARKAGFTAVPVSQGGAAVETTAMRRPGDRRSSSAGG